MTDPRTEPVRRGLPLDPILQLYAGQVVGPRSVVTAGGQWDAIAVADPNRVCLYIFTTPGLYFLSPVPDNAIVDTTRPPSIGPAPTVIHCRDYPGLAQGPWWILTTSPQSVLVWDYRLSPWW